MRYVFWIIGFLAYVIFAYDIENDRDFWTWMWLGTSVFFFINSFLHYRKDIDEKNI